MMERKRKEEVVKEGRTSRREAVMEHRTATGREGREEAERIFIYFTRNVIKVTVVMLAVTMATEDRGAAVHSENQQ